MENELGKSLTRIETVLETNTGKELLAWMPWNYTEKKLLERNY